jgi:hypothetical protein
MANRREKPFAHQLPQLPKQSGISIPGCFISSSDFDPGDGMLPWQWGKWLKSCASKVAITQKRFGIRIPNRFFSVARL